MADQTVTKLSIEFNTHILIDPSFCSKTSLRQIGFSAVASLYEISVGMAIAFAEMMPEVGESVPMTEDDVYWIALAFTLSMAAGSLCSGFVMDRIGRRASIVLAQLPISLGLIFTGFSTTGLDLLLARALVGVGCGMSFPVIVYPTEISQPKIRGVVCTFPHIARSLGATLQVGLGFLISWKIIAICGGVCNVILGFGYIFIPESPYFLTMTGNIDAVKDNLKRLRNKEEFSIAYEVEDLQDFKEANNIRSWSGHEVARALILWSTIKPFLISLGYFSFVQLSGAQILFSLGQNILVQSKTSMTVEMAKLTHSLLILISGFSTAVIMYRLKRKTMAIVSAIGVFVTCMVLGTVIRTIHINSVSSQVLYGTYAFFSTLGYYTIAYIMMTEIYPLQLRGLLIGITLSLHWFMQAICSDILFITLLMHIGLSYILYFFGVCSFFGAIYCFFIVPETKDLTLIEIEEYFNHRRPTLVSQRRVQSQMMFEEYNQLKKRSVPTVSLSKRPSTEVNPEIEARRKKTKWSGLLNSPQGSTSTTSSNLGTNVI